jgi:benzoyl-CoA reductase subunit D
MITAGIDSGSKELKGVLFDGQRVLSRVSDTGGMDAAETAERLFQRLLAEGGVTRAEVAHVAATGMGRDAVGFADSRVTDVTAAARAAAFYFPGLTSVIEVGAEESRAIKTDGRGRVLDSAVNEKCAAGTGSFTESMARALGMTLDEFARASVESTVKIPMNAQCTVFAESEVISLIHQNVDRGDIARAVHDAIAARVSSMARRIKLEGVPVCLGGMAKNPGFLKSLAEHLGVERVEVPEHPAFADALGAALVAAARGAK